MAKKKASKKKAPTKTATPKPPKVGKEVVAHLTLNGRAQRVIAVVEEQHDGGAITVRVNHPGVPDLVRELVPAHPFRFPGREEGKIGWEPLPKETSSSEASEPFDLGKAPQPVLELTGDKDDFPPEAIELGAELRLSLRSALEEIAEPVGTEADAPALELIESALESWTDETVKAAGSDLDYIFGTLLPSLGLAGAAAPDELAKTLGEVAKAARKALDT